MAVPKRKTSKSRRNKRRTHHRLAEPAMAPCPECRKPRPPHSVCANCGSYRKRTVVETGDEG